MKLTQAEIDALFAAYAGNPDSLEKANQPVGQEAPESEEKASADSPPASDAPAIESEQTQQAEAAATAAGKEEGWPAARGSQASQAAAPATFPPLRPTSGLAKENPTLGVLANVELDVSVCLGHTRKSIREILSLGPGSVVELDTLAGEAVDIEVNGRVVARGEVVVVGENYGVRITELVSPDGGPAE